MKKIILILLFLSFSQPSLALSDKIYKELDTFTKLIEILDKNYVDVVDEHKLIEGAIRGMLSSLDPHTVYMEPQIYRDFQSDTEGRFGGVGIEISVKDSVLTVVAPIEGSPADKAGIKAGDRILKIDSKLTKDLSLIDAVHMMRGNKGEKVTLSIWREGLTKTQDFTLVRDIIRVESVKSENLGDGYVYARISTFQEHTGDKLREAMDKMAEKEKKIRGLVLDLRNNPGGLLSEAVKVSDLFMEKGVVVSTRGRDKDVDYQKAKNNSPYEGIPIIILVNKGSASASEIVAGALQDVGLAKIMGTTSFGKGSVQTLVDLGDKSALKVTIARYYTPKGRSIDGKGIVPDIEMGLDQYYKDYPKQKGKAENEEGESKSEGKAPAFVDWQKQKAIDALKKM
ncbi:MAG TPA: peptidase S41 [Deltaproteobacteria bacterium]|nr:peptidase S41 [Deltaproteobacteria bacterium]